MSHLSCVREIFPVESGFMRARGGQTPPLSGQPAAEASDAPTVRSIARACGVGHGTVGRALTGHPNVSAETRAAVLAMAKKLGYKPDPMLSALSRRRWPQGSKSTSATIAWIYAGEDNHRSGRLLRPEAAAAGRRAAELGYKLEYFNLAEYPAGARLSRVLVARGIRGVLVQADFRATVRLAVRECVNRGYVRPAFALMNYGASGTSEPIFAQTLAERERLRERNPAQPEIFHWDADDAGRAAAAHAWIRAARPDCLITSHATICFWLTNPRHFGVKRYRPLRIPEDVPVVSLRKESALPGLAFTGLREKEQGTEAVNLLHRQLQLGRVGVPEVPMRMLVPPEYVDGTSLPWKTGRA